MAVFNVLRQMCTWLYAIQILATVVAGQSVDPSNDTLPDAELDSVTQLTIVGPAADDAPQTVFNIAPLTVNVGLGQNPTSIASFNISGNLVETNYSSIISLTTAEIAYISCDPSLSDIDASSVVATASEIKPIAIILYSLSSEECNLTGSYPYTTMYSMTQNVDSEILLETIQAFNTSLGNLTALIHLSSNDSTTPGTITDSGPPPTTRVAMIIVYTSTACFTLLFISFIVGGCYRVMRHPDLYGEGSQYAKQNRAKVLTRAWLDGFPVVKFGDPESANKIELANRNKTTRQQGNSDSAATSSSEPGVTSGTRPETRAEAVQGGPTAECAICTEEFRAGENVRVLPCHHKYHPTCIDPWLIKESGSCPLCRRDLGRAVNRQANRDNTTQTRVSNASNNRNDNNRNAAAAPTQHPNTQEAMGSSTTKEYQSHDTQEVAGSSSNQPPQSQRDET